MMWYGGWGWGGWLIMSLAMIAIWAIAIPAVVLAIRYLAGGGGHPHANSWDPPRVEELLAQRFARGEIDEDEYRRRIALLPEHRGAGDGFAPADTARRDVSMGPR